jgi:signal transduction histidine kinase
MNHQQLQQAIHDLKSPIYAIQNMVEDLEPKTKKLIETGLERMEAILHGLSQPLSQSTLLEKVELRDLLQELIEEKQWEYKLFDGIYLQLKAPLATHSLAYKQGLKRALSNIINNAVEAIGEQGVIELNLYKGVTTNIITIKDNGRGIPSRLLSQVTKRGVSYGKTHGQGLGLSYAKEIIELCGGSLTLSSQQSFGSEVTIILPQEA